MTLPLGTEPLVLQDGTQIDPIDGTIVPDSPVVEVPNTEDIQREIVATRRRMSDLPCAPERMNVISVVLAYSLFGISEEDLAVHLGVPIEQIRALKMSDAYAEIQTSLIEQIIKSDENDVRGLFVQESRSAAKKVFTLINSEDDGTALSASKDVLDRAGQRPVDVVEHRHRVEGGLTIRYLKREEEVPITPDLGDF